MKPARLGDAVLSMKNGMYKPASEYGEDGVPCLRMYNIDAGAIVWRDIKRMRVSAAELEDYGLREGDLLVNRVNSRELVGKTACIPAALEPSVFESKNIRVRLDSSKALPKFISYQLLAGGRRHFEGNAQQVVGMASISQGQIADFPIVLTDIDEQREIVAEIEKQFSRLDEAVAGLKRVKANLKRYKAAILKAAVEGRLVPTEANLAHCEGRGYETGTKLLQRILDTRRDQWQGKKAYKEPVEPRDGWVRSVPRGWAVASLESVTSANRVICYGILMPKENVLDGVLFVKVRDIKNDRVVVESLHRTTQKIAASYARASLRAGDLLLSIRGTFGRVATVPPVLEGGNITQDTVRLDVSPLVDTDYIALFLRSDDAQRYFKAVARGVAVKGVNVGDLRPMAVPLPPMAEQHRIVAEVDRLLSIAREVETEVETNLKRAQSLRQAILSKAFVGDLIQESAEQDK